MLQYPSAPLIWIIASRPETHLKTTFSEDAVKPSFWEEDVPIDSAKACQDVEKFLHNKFTEIQHHHSDHIHETPWPTQSQFLRITTAACGLFIFAEVIIRFISDSSIGNPVAQLRCVISIISKIPLSQLRRNPLAVLDALAKIKDFDLHCICNSLNIARDDAVTALRHLHSVLFFKKVRDIGKTCPHFYHTSFRDFVEDPSRSNEYSIDVGECGSALFWGSQALVEAMSCSRQISLSWPGDEDNNSEWLVDFTAGRIRGILKSFDSSNCTAPFYSIRVPIPQTRLSSIFANANYRQLLENHLFMFGFYLSLIMYSSGRGAALATLREHKIVTYATLPSLGVDKARLMNSTIRRLTNQTLVELDKPVMLILYFSSWTWPPPIEVAIWGGKSSGRCAIIKPDRHDINGSSSKFYVVGF
ncbi:hypothetical protein P691DRAFT_779510 [Macrolepiota fuliginosa MF-IS2]|uniref:Uncharacterized protein n=1 Tax=Macrolepiota fuliginosa MF-IS2 TaxID=1400762 RepID=A0A9P5X1D5_9AGAR|nr:hypothetical protein P691DRAFT_779510 [Macrolepiota fuliginosa MF-IS2]